MSATDSIVTCCDVTPLCFYRYEPPRPLEAIQADIRKLETEIVEMLGEVAK